MSQRKQQQLQLQAVWKWLQYVKQWLHISLEVLDTSSVSLGERCVDEQWREVRLKWSQRCLCEWIPRGEVQRSGAASAQHITLEQMNYSAFFIFLGNNSHMRKLKYTHAELIIHAFSHLTSSRTLLPLAKFRTGINNCNVRPDRQSIICSYSTVLSRAWRKVKFAARKFSWGSSSFLASICHLLSHSWFGQFSYLCPSSDAANDGLFPAPLHSASVIQVLIMRLITSSF